MTYVYKGVEQLTVYDTIWHDITLQVVNSMVVSSTKQKVIVYFGRQVGVHDQERFNFSTR